MKNTGYDENIGSNYIFNSLYIAQYTTTDYQQAILDNQTNIFLIPRD